MGVHVLAILALLLPILLLRNITNTSLIAELLIGGIVGTFLPDLDHIVYALFLKPNELTSQRVRKSLATWRLREACTLLFRTTSERSGLIFHTVFFQLLFVVFSFFVVTSSGSLLGRGIVLGFLLSIFIDQLLDSMSQRDHSHWLKNMPVSISRSQFQWYLWLQALLILLLGYVF